MIEFLQVSFGQGNAFGKAPSEGQGKEGEADLPERQLAGGAAYQVHLQHHSWQDIPSWKAAG